MPQTLPARTPHQPAPCLTLLGELALPLGRVHEICGRARRTLALMIAAQAGAPVFWIAPKWGTDPVNPTGMSDLLPPQNVIFVTPEQTADMLWCMEETLRAGCVPVVVVDLPEPPALTPVRRLHLAAQAGIGQGRCRPLGLLLTPGDGGAPGIETRWQIDPSIRTTGDSWTLTRQRARMAPPKHWILKQGHRGLYLCPPAHG